MDSRNDCTYKQRSKRKSRAANHSAVHFPKRLRSAMTTTIGPVRLQCRNFTVVNRVRRPFVTHPHTTMVLCQEPYYKCESESSSKTDTKLPNIGLLSNDSLRGGSRRARKDKNRNTLNERPPKTSTPTTNLNATASAQSH